MRRLLLILILLSCPAWASFSVVQRASLTPCLTGNTSCAITVASTGAGHIGVVVAQFSDTTTVIASVSGGGTYTICCHSTDGTISRGLDIAYTLNSTSGATTITVNLSQALPSTARFAYEELSFGATSTVAVDNSGTVDDAACTSCAGVGLTLTGSNDAIIQGESNNSGSGGVTGISSPYTFHAVQGAFAYADVLNTTSGTAPTWTQGASGKAIGAAIAFSESSSSTSTLTIACAGTGTGTTTSSPAGINATCTAGSASGTTSAPFTTGASITLTSTPNANSNATAPSLSGGGCSTSPCTLTLSANTTVTVTFTANGGGATVWSLTNQQPNTWIPYQANFQCLTCKQLPNAGLGGPTNHLYSSSAPAISQLLPSGSNNGLMVFYGPHGDSNQGRAFYYGSGSLSGSATYKFGQLTYAPNMNVTVWCRNHAEEGPSIFDEGIACWDQDQNIMLQGGHSCVGSTANFCGYNGSLPAGGSSLASPTSMLGNNNYFNAAGAQRPFGGPTNTDKDWGWDTSSSFTYLGYTMGYGSSLGNAAWGGMLRTNGEVLAGAINHALVAGFACTNGSHVFPAVGDLAGPGVHNCTTTTAPNVYTGQLVFCDYTDSQIANMSIHPFQKTILKALCHYGTYLGVTGGAGFQFEPAAQNEIETGEAWAQAAGLGIGSICDTSSATYNKANCDTTANPAFYNELFSEFGSGVENANIFTNIPSLGCGGIACHLHVADPCVAAGMAGLTGANQFQGNPAPCVASLWVNIVGAGHIGLSGSGAPISCKNGFCDQTTENGSQQTLSVTHGVPGDGTFTGWTGCTPAGNCTNCPNGSTGNCIVTLTASNGLTRVTANFSVNPPPTFTITAACSGTGNGSFTSSPAGISATCTAGVVSGTTSAAFGGTVSFTANASAGSNFTGWTVTGVDAGACTGAGTCSFTVTGADTVSAAFTTSPPSTGKAGAPVVSY